MRALLSALFILSTSAHAAYNKATPLADGFTVQVEQLRWEDTSNPATPVAYPISQLSDPDGVCEWLGYESAVAVYANGMVSKETKVIEAGGVPGELDASTSLALAFCRLAKKTGGVSSAHYDYKTREKNGDITVELPRPAPNVQSPVPGVGYWFYRFAAASDLTGLCKLYGYSKGISVKLTGPFPLSDDYYFAATVDGQGRISDVSKDRWRERNDANKDIYLQSVTCQK